MIFIGQERDVDILCRHVAVMAREVAMAPIDQVDILTASRELSRYILEYARTGLAVIKTIDIQSKKGLLIIFQDHSSNFTNQDEEIIRRRILTRSALGIGLSYSKSLVDEFSIRTTPEKGIEVTIIKWSGLVTP